MNVIVRYPSWDAKLDSVKELEFVFDVPPSKTHYQVLEMLFVGFGNAPHYEMDVWKEAKIRSMSVGDFVCLDGRWYQCASCDWIQVPETKVSRVMGMPVYQTWKDEELRYSNRKST